MSDTMSLPHAHAGRPEPCAACGRISLDRNATACLSCGAPLSAPRLHKRHRAPQARKQVPSHGQTARVAPGRPDTLEWTPQVPAQQALTQRNTPRPRPRVGEHETRREVPRPSAGAEVIQLPGAERDGAAPDEPIASTMSFEWEVTADDDPDDWADDGGATGDRSEPDLDLSRARREGELDDAFLEMSGLRASQRRKWLLVALLVAGLGGAAAAMLV